MHKGSRRVFPLGSFQINATRLNYVESRLLQKKLHHIENNYRGEFSRLDRQCQDLRFHYTNVVRVVKSNAAFEIWRQSNVRNKPPVIRSKREEAREAETRPLLLLVEPPKQENFVEKEINFEEEVLRPSTTSNEHRRNQLLRTNPLNRVLSHRPLSREQTFVREKFQSTSEVKPLHRIALQNQPAWRVVEQTFNEKRFPVQNRPRPGPVRSSTMISISNVSSS